MCNSTPHGTRAALALTYLVLLLPPSGAQERFDPSTAPQYHAPPSFDGILIEPAFEDYAFMLFDVCDALEVGADACMIYPMMGRIGNAVATVIDGNRVIIYDRTLSDLVGHDGAQAIIAHELGHHFCGHLATEAVASHDIELEADTFAGAAMRKLGFPRDSVLEMAAILDDRPSVSHPPRAMRVEAMYAGWDDPDAGIACAMIE